MSNQDEMKARLERIRKLEAEVKQLREWVDDLQSGMFINCVYCGHRYGPNDEVPASMADVLKEHVEQCPEHPLFVTKAEMRALEEEIELCPATNYHTPEEVKP